MKKVKSGSTNISVQDNVCGCDKEEKCDIVSFYKERVEYLETLVRKYKFDSLTGLMGKSDFSDKLDILYEEYKFSGEDFYLVLIDINNLHNINRTQGYFAGDSIIKAVTSSLQHIFQFHQIYRVSGDEFGVLIRTYQVDDCNALKEQLDALEGVTYIIIEPDGFTQPKNMFKEADAQLSKKKKTEKRL